MPNSYYFWVCTRCGRRIVSTHRPGPGACHGSPSKQLHDFVDTFNPQSKNQRSKPYPPHRWVKDGLATEEDYRKFVIEEQHSNNVASIGCLIVVLLIVAFFVFGSQHSSNKVNNSSPSTVVVRGSEHSAVQSTDGDSIVDKTNETVKLQQSTDTDNTARIESFGGKAVELIKAKKFDAGIQLAEKYLATYPNDYDVNFYLGCAYAETNKNELAERYFLKAVQLEHQRAVAWFNLAAVQSRNGDYKKSASSFVQFYKLANDKKIARSKIRKIADKKSPESKGAIEALKILKL